MGTPGSKGTLHPKNLNKIGPEILIVVKNGRVVYDGFVIGHYIIYLTR